MQLTKDIKHFVGSSAGPKVAIMGSIHGNEPIGKLVIDQLAKDLSDEKINGELFLIFGNPKAYKKNVRFIEHDMNRLFQLDFTANHSLSYEEKRVLEISEILKNVDYLLDIHSTTKPSTVFVYCELDEQHLELAKIFETKYIVGTANNFKPKERTSSSDNFVDKNGGIGITFESGWNKDLNVFAKVLKQAKNFLAYLNVCFEFEQNSFAKPDILEIFMHAIPKSESFNFAKDFANFDFVSNGDPLAKEQGEQITSHENAYMVFPQKYPSVGKPAFYLARSLDSNF